MNFSDQTTTPSHFNSHHHGSPKAATLLGRSPNERLILQMIRDSGPTPKADLARQCSLSAQTVSVIINRLIEQGLLKKQNATKGKVGQPSVPIALDPMGAYCLGVRIGRRSTEVVLLNFIGEVIAERATTYRQPIAKEVLHSACEMIQELAETLPIAHQERIVGVGLGMPFSLDQWADELGVPSQVLNAWTDANPAHVISSRTNLPVSTLNDATAACLAELLKGKHANTQSFIHYYIGTFIGGGIVLDGNLMPGTRGNAAAVGSMLIPDTSPGHLNAQPRQLISLASRFHLERALDQANVPLDHASVTHPITQDWLSRAAQALAISTVNAAAIMEIDVAILDTNLPTSLLDALIEQTNSAIALLDTSGVEKPIVARGTIGASAGVWGAGLVPLYETFGTSLATTANA